MHTGDFIRGSFALIITSIVLDHRLPSGILEWFTTLIMTYSGLFLLFNSDHWKYTEGVLKTMPKGRPARPFREFMRYLYGYKHGREDR